jgi:ribonuclease HI
MYYIFTDGACPNNGKSSAQAAYSVILWNFPDYKDPFAIAEKVPSNEPQTNQRAELRGLSRAFEEIKKLNTTTPITIYTDSDYGRKCVTEWGLQWSARGWKRAQNSKKPIEHLDLLKPMIEFYQQSQHYVRIQHIKAHTGKKEFPYCGNEMADKYASEMLLK